MGNLVFLNDAPDDIGSAEELYRFPFSLTVYGQVIGEFTRSEVAPDVDIYDTQVLLKDTEVFVALYPSFLFFDDILDSGNVTIEVLNASGAVVPSTPVDLSSNAVALTMIKFTTGPDDARYYYRLTPDSGLVHGEYLLADNAPPGSTGPTLAREGNRRHLQDGLDGDSIPFDFLLGDLYGNSAQSQRYDDFDIGGSPFSGTGKTFRLGFFAGGPTVDFQVTSNSPDPTLQVVKIGGTGIIETNNNYTLVDGNADIQLSVTDERVMFVVFRFDTESDVQIEARHAGAQSNVGTHSCVERGFCSAGKVTIPGLAANELFAVDLRMNANLVEVNAIPFVDSNTGTAYGSFFTGFSCIMRGAGVLFAPTTTTGKIEIDITPSISVIGCSPDLGILGTAISLNEYLGIDNVLQSYSSSVRETCDTALCSSGSIEMSAANGFAAISNLTMLVQGFAGSRLTLSMDNVTFYNESFTESCTNDPDILTNLVLPVSSSLEKNLSIHYELEEPTVCSNRQNLVVGVVGFTEQTSISPSSGGAIDDAALAAGLSTAAVLVVLGSLLFLFFRSSVTAGAGTTELGMKQKEEA